MKRILLVIVSSTLFLACSRNCNTIAKTTDPEKITFLSLDSLPITANLYHSGDNLPVIVLCHQAGLNKSEYIKIAETLTQNGYNCLAIDQRSGGHFVEWFNETMLKAIEKGSPFDYLDAEQDIVAAIDFASKKYKKKVILWGSSYSAALAIHIAASNNNVDAVIAFSPGDYFNDKKQPLRDVLKDFSKPFFITSSRDEAVELSKIFDSIKFSDTQVHFVPKNKGVYGSRALWRTSEDNAEYWIAVERFLDVLSSSKF